MTQMQEAPAYDASAVQEEESSGSNRRVLALVLVLAVLLLGAAGWFLLGGGDDTDESLGVPPVLRRPAVTKPTAGPVKPAATLPPVSTTKIGRDPFKPQYVAPVAALGPATGSDTGTGTPTGGAPGTGTDKPVAATTYPLKLASVSGTGTDLTAKFLVGETKKIQFAKAGSVFGATGEIRLLSIEKGPNGAGTAVIQVGDDSPFDLSTSDAAVFVQ